MNMLLKKKTLLRIIVNYPLQQNLSRKKKKKPLEVLQSIYDIGFCALKKICLQTGRLTDSVRDWLNYAIAVANKLKVNIP